MPDPDKPLTSKEFKSMKWMRFHELPQEVQDSIARMGRPRLEHPKDRVTIRLDHDILSALRNQGKGWQTRLNALLRQALQNGQI